MGDTVNVVCRGEGENERRHKFVGVKVDRVISERNERNGGAKER